MAARRKTQRNIVLLLSPQVRHLPLPMQRYDDPFLPFGRAVIEATQNLVCGYVFDLASYLALGAAGAIALERTLPFVDRELITILHGPFWGPQYAGAAFESAFTCDAVTLVNDIYLDSYTKDPVHSAFVVHDGLPRTARVHGVFWHDVRLFTYPLDVESIVNIRLADEKVLYASGGIDFQEKLVDALNAMHRE